MIGAIQRRSSTGLTRRMFIALCACLWAIKHEQIDVCYLETSV